MIFTFNETGFDIILIITLSILQVIINVILSEAKNLSPFLKGGLRGFQDSSFRRTPFRMTKTILLYLVSVLFTLFVNGKKIIPLIFFFLLLFNFNIYSQDKVQDSVKVKFPEIVVTATKLNKTPGTEFSAYSNISKSDFEKKGAIQLSDAIQNVPGIFIKNYGGMGGFKTLSLRGTNAQQTVIMLDGIRINSTQNGISDLSVIPLSFTNEIEIVRGGNSALFGGNAIGGVVNIITQTYDTSNSLTGNLQYGSYNDFHIAVGAQNFETLHDDVVINSAIDYQHSDGNYSFETNEYGFIKTKQRTNADFENFVFNFSLSSKPSSFNYSVKSIGRISDRGTPGAVTQGNIENANARLSEKEIIIIGNVSNLISESGILSVNSLFKINDYHYKDPLWRYSPNGFNEIFTNRDLQIVSKYDYKKGNLNLGLNLDVDYSDLRGNMLQPKIGNYIQRKTLGFSCRLEHSFNLFSISEFNYQLGIRFDAISNISSAVSPLIGFIYHFDSIPIKMRCNYTFNFRPPSFNEMYYLNYGTENLKPERSHSLNVGMSYEPFPKTVIEAEGFVISTQNLILSVPESPLEWRAQNIGKVLNRGIEFNLKSNLFDNLLVLQFAYTLQKVTDDYSQSPTYGKQLPYIPQELIEGVIDFNYYGFTLGINNQHSSYYYYLPGENVNSIMPAYNILNFYLLKSFELFKSKLDLRLDCSNVFDSQYSVLRNYPMPGRLFKAGISIKL